VSSFKKEQNARKQYRSLSRKYPELRTLDPEYRHVNVKGFGPRVRTYIRAPQNTLEEFCVKMRKDLKDACLITKAK